MERRRLIMARINLLEIGYAGVDLKTNPLLLGQKRKLRSAVNLIFEEGVIRTRPGFRYQLLAGPGKFQGATDYKPSRGISAGRFSDASDSVALVIDGSLWLNCNQVASEVFVQDADVHLFQAENYLIVQQPEGDTFWWDGTTLTCSPGLQEVDFTETETPVFELNEGVPTGQPVDCDSNNPFINTHLKFTVINHVTEAYIEGATVSVTYNENPSYEGVTNALGEYEIRKIVARTYAYSVVKDGYLPVEAIPFEIEVGDDMEIVVRLVPLGDPEVCGFSTVLVDGPTVDETWTGGYVDIEITNTGDSNIMVSGILGGFPWVTDPELPVTVAPDTTETIRVGNQSGSDISGQPVVFQTSCGESTEIIVGSTNPCDYDVNITAHYAGNISGIPVAEGFYLEFDLVNNSLSDLTINSITSDEPTVFHYVSPDEFPITIPGGSTQAFQIRAVADYPNAGNQPFTSKITTEECGDYVITWPTPQPVPDP